MPYIPDPNDSYKERKELKGVILCAGTTAQYDKLIKREKNEARVDERHQK